MMVRLASKTWTPAISARGASPSGVFSANISRNLAPSSTERITGMPASSEER